MKKILYIFIALNLLGIGINFVLQVGFGCDAITMMNDGIARFFHTNYTVAGLLYNTFFVALALLFSRNLLGWGSILYAYGTGVLIDIYKIILSPLHLEDVPMFVQVLVLIVGQLMICFAFAMLMELNLGRSSLDAILTKIGNQFHISYRIIKTMCDIIFVVMAYMLGATFGLGTISCILTGGYTIDFFCKLLNQREIAIE